MGQQLPGRPVVVVRVVVTRPPEAIGNAVVQSGIDLAFAGTAGTILTSVFADATAAAPAPVVSPTALVNVTVGAEQAPVGYVVVVMPVTAPFEIEATKTPPVQSAS